MLMFVGATHHHWWSWLSRPSVCTTHTLTCCRCPHKASHPHTDTQPWATKSWKLKSGNTILLRRKIPNWRTSVEWNGGTGKAWVLLASFLYCSLPLSSLLSFLSFLFPSRRCSLEPFIENSVSRTVCESSLYCWRRSGAGIVITVATTKWRAWLRAWLHERSWWWWLVMQKVWAWI